MSEVVWYNSTIISNYGIIIWYTCYGSVLVAQAGLHGRGRDAQRPQLEPQITSSDKYKIHLSMFDNIV